MSLRMVYGEEEKDYEEMAYQAGIPDYMAGALHRYVEKRINGGSFLSAVLRNDLKGAVACADEKNVQCLSSYMMFLTWCVPNSCWGSAEKVKAWLAGEKT